MISWPSLANIESPLNWKSHLGLESVKGKKNPCTALTIKELHKTPLLWCCWGFECGVFLLFCFCLWGVLFGCFFFGGGGVFCAGGSVIWGSFLLAFLVILIQWNRNKNHKEYRNWKLNPANIKHKQKKYLLEKSWKNLTHSWLSPCFLPRVWGTSADKHNSYFWKLIPFS